MGCTTFRQRHEAKEDHTAPGQLQRMMIMLPGWAVEQTKGDILGRNNQHGRLSLRIENLLIIVIMMSSK